ncbi:hypothetical protein AB0K18_24800 [Nonomuraea sp. NPDC049421]|uniref:hypothetical protein n=1 Tax=Nonomuraea sp. NPDC049421 TaxID=3155275 RepID=UPI0034391131
MSREPETSVPLNAQHDMSDPVTAHGIRAAGPDVRADGRRARRRAPGGGREAATASGLRDEGGVPVAVTPFDLLMSTVLLSASGEIHAGRRSIDRDGWRLRVLHARTATDVHGGHWALHPEADELVSCIVGKIRLYLRGEGRGEEEIRLCAGTAAIVPRGRCHRIALDIPSTILTATLPPANRLDQPA